MGGRWGLGGSGGTKEITTPHEKWGRDLQKGANDSQRIGNLEGRNIGAFVNREGIAVMGGEGE